ncbi:MAG: type IV pilus assembly protein PilM [Kiritimatiellae bacterium]|nr:type IV pilus assembly protein PilM [Kiritimatiellia bacterium]
MAKRYLTLDIGASAVKLAEFEGGKGGLTLVNYGIAALAAPLDAGNAGALLSPALLDIVREKGIKPGPVAISISGQMVFPRFASIAAAGGAEKFDQMIRFEIEQNIPFPIDEMICDRQVLGDNENGEKNVMIVAAKTDQVEDIAAAVRGAGFTPELVDVAPIAITNVLRYAGAAGDECCVLLDIGSKTTSLVIADGDKLYNRSIPVAGNTITKEIASALGCTAEEAEAYKREAAYVALGGVVEDEDETRDRVSKVCRAVMTRLHAEVSRSINFYRSQQGGSVPVKLYITGGTALLPQLDRFFSESLQLEVEYVNPFAVVGTGPKIDTEALESDGTLLPAVVGLAVHMAGLATFSINLLPPSLLKERADVARIPFVAIGAVAFIAALALVMLAARRSATMAEAENSAVSAEASRLRSVESKVKDAVAVEEREAAKADVFKTLLVKRNLSVGKLMAIRTALGNEMWIEKWEGDRITVRGWADDLKTLVSRTKTGGSTAAQILEARIKGSPIVDPNSVKIESMTDVGKDAALKQIVVVVKFGKEESR